MDRIINDTVYPESHIERPGRSNRHNINTALVTYATSLQKEITIENTRVG